MFRRLFWNLFCFRIAVRHVFGMKMGQVIEGKRGMNRRWESALYFILGIVCMGIAQAVLTRGMSGAKSDAVERVPTGSESGFGVTDNLRRIGLAIVLGAVFFAILLAVQWYFSKFMLSPYARNWFFMSDRVFGYNFPKGEWQTQFWRLDPNNPNAVPITVSSRSLLLSRAQVPGSDSSSVVGCERSADEGRTFLNRRRSAV
jgi:hypothetical protein